MVPPLKSGPVEKHHVGQGRWESGPVKGESGPPRQKIHSCTGEHDNLPEGKNGFAACEESSIVNSDGYIIRNATAQHFNRLRTGKIIYFF